MQNGGSDDDTSANRERRGTRFVMITVSNLFTFVSLFVGNNQTKIPSDETREGAKSNFVSLFVGNNTTSRLKYTATRKGKMQC